jgi:hypothetical protein
MKIMTRERGGGFIYDRVRIPFILRGAINRSVFAGHIRCLGVEVGWNGNGNGWANSYYLSLWGIVAWRFEDTKGGTLKAVHPGLAVSWCKLDLKAVIQPAKKHT